MVIVLLSYHMIAGKKCFCIKLLTTLHFYKVNVKGILFEVPCPPKSITTGNERNSWSEKIEVKAYYFMKVGLVDLSTHGG